MNTLKEPSDNGEVIAKIVFYAKTGEIITRKYKAGEIFIRKYFLSNLILSRRKTVYSSQR